MCGTGEGTVVSAYRLGVPHSSDRSAGGSAPDIGKMLDMRSDVGI